MNFSPIVPKNNPDNSNVAVQPRELNLEENVAEKRPTEGGAEPVQKIRKKVQCSACGEEGHNKSNAKKCKKHPNCQTKNQFVDATNINHNIDNSNNIDPNKLIHFCFDIETTGLSHTTSEIIELFCVALIGKKKKVSGNFHMFAKPVNGVGDSHEIHGIQDSDEKLVNAPKFEEVGRRFMDFVNLHCNQFDECSNAAPAKAVFVAHNGNTFDVPFLLKQLEKCSIPLSNQIIGKWDPLPILQKMELNPIPQDRSLGTMLERLCNQRLVNAHSAEADVNAMVKLLLLPQVWNVKNKTFKAIGEDEFSLSEAVVDDDECLPDAPMVDDSGNEMVEPVQREQMTVETVDDNDSDEEMEQENEGNADAPSISGWLRDSAFEGGDSNKLFWEKRKEEAPSPTKTRNQEAGTTTRVGLKCSDSTVNSAPKAWNKLFSKRVQKFVVQKTNEHGAVKMKDWKPVTEEDIRDFIAVLWIVCIQSRKDTPSDWFSETIVGCKHIQKIMTKRRFFEILMTK